MAHANLERSPDQLIEQLNHQRSLKLALAVALLALGFISVYIAYATM